MRSHARRMLTLLLAAPLVLALAAGAARAQQADSPKRETRAAYDARMAWWAEARFGLFIHWGLYAVPAGKWKGKTGYGEWIRSSAQIPLDEYDRFREGFRAEHFDADAWVRAAKDAGMRYIVVTTKHHDGFCLFPSDETDFDVASTPFGRDAMAELAAACRREGLRICWYHSIMDWHHPDYLPRRDWERDRPAGGASYDRYVAYLKAQLRELLTRYGPIGVLWFDGEWEGTWTRERGRDLYAYVRSMQPDIVVNNRVGAGRSGMEGFSEDAAAAGDYGTPEQRIPATGVPGAYWETCMTMGEHWGYNRLDTAWKSPSDLLRKLADIASKGGNFLLNVGPTAEGVFPPAAMQRLRAIGAWMRVNGEAIYGTQASPFDSLPWGRCTRKPVAGGERLYLHVFEWPGDGRLVLRGLYTRPDAAYLLSDAKRTALAMRLEGGELTITVPRAVPDSVSSVVVLEVRGALDVDRPPTISAPQPIFIDTMSVEIASARPRVELRYTLDGSHPTPASPVAAGSLLLDAGADIVARCFRDGAPVSGEARASFRKVAPLRPERDLRPLPNLAGWEYTGLRYKYFEEAWDSLPAFDGWPYFADTGYPTKATTYGTVDRISLESCPAEDRRSRRIRGRRVERFGVSYGGLLRVPVTGVYTFHLGSDDGSRLLIDTTLVCDNDGLHAFRERSGAVALEAGWHWIRVDYFQATGGMELTVAWSGPGMPKRAIETGDTMPSPPAR